MNQHVELRSLYPIEAGGFTGGHPLRWISYRMMVWSLLGLVIAIACSLLVTVSLAHHPQQYFHLHVNIWTAPGRSQYL